MPGELDRQFNSSTANAANTVNAATLNAIAGRRNYVTGITLIMGGATAVSNVDATLTNIVNGPMHFAVDVPSPVGALPFTLVKNFAPPLPATNVNQGIQINMPAGGAGNVEASVSIEGFSLPEP